MNIRTCDDGVVRDVVLPSYLQEVYDKIAATAGDSAIVMLHGWSRFDRTDIAVVSPARIELALEDVVLALVPRGAGEITFTLFNRGRKEKTMSLSQHDDGRLYVSVKPTVMN